MLRNPGCIGYTLRGNRYINVTNRCTLRCAFCPKFSGTWTVQSYRLRLAREPTADEMVASVGNPTEFREVVFCGLGEPTLRLYEVLETAARLRKLGARRIRINTDGLASLVFGRDVTPDFEDLIDALSISMNGQDARTYNQHCRPRDNVSFASMLKFTSRAREFVPDVSVSAIDGLPGVDVSACSALADRMGVKFRRRELGKVG